MDFDSKIKEKFDIAFDAAYKKMEQQEPTWSVKVVRKMLKDSADYDADVIEYLKYLMEKSDITLDNEPTCS
jgi:hypothetical protein